MKFSTKTKSIAYVMEISHGIRRAIVGALALVYFLSLGFNVISVCFVVSCSMFKIEGCILTNSAQLA